jgi:hypothetical protein
MAAVTIRVDVISAEASIFEGLYGMKAKGSE